MYHFCTVSSQSHLYKVSALAESLSSFNLPVTLHVLVTDATPTGTQNNIKMWSLENLQGDEIAVKILAKYRDEADKLRWSLKPAFMNFLLQQAAINSLVYVDNDIFFYSPFGFIFNLLNSHSILLTPHYYNNNPHKNQNWLEANFRSGLYNAGFVGASKQGMATLQWWAGCCTYRCEKNFIRGIFDDQRYLDLVPVMDESAFILRHKGCNVAGWNLELSPRQLRDGEVLIDDSFPVIFIHFNDITIRRILNGEDGLLLNYYEQYETALKRHKPGLTRNDLYRPVPLVEKLKYMAWKAMN